MSANTFPFSTQEPNSQYGYGTGYDLVGAQQDPNSQYGYGTGWDLVGAKMWMDPYGQMYGNVAGDPRSGVLLNYPARTSGTMDDVKNWLNEKKLGNVENKWWVVGGVMVAGAGLWYAYKKRYIK